MLEFFQVILSTESLDRAVLSIVTGMLLVELREKPLMKVQVMIQKLISKRKR